MTHPTVHFLVTGPNPVPGLSIPTRGRVTSLVDAMRIVGVDHIDNKPDNWVSIDYKVEDAVVRLIQGGIESEIDIQLIEQAIRAYLFADYLDVYRPIVYSHSKFGVWPHLLQSTNAHDFAYELFADITSRDVLVVSANIQVEDGIILSSTNGLIDVHGIPINQLDEHSDKLDATLSHFITAAALPLNSYSGVSFGISHESDINGIDPILNRLIGTIDREWKVNRGPAAVHLSGYVLPPFISTVLHRAKNRESIPDALASLRKEFKDIRIYILNLEREISTSNDDSTISKKIAELDQLLKAVIPASLEDDVYDNKRGIFNSISLLFAITSIAGFHAFATIGAVVNELARSHHSKALEQNPNARIISKSLVAGKLSRAFRVGSLSVLLKKHLHSEELIKLGY